MPAPIDLYDVLGAMKTEFESLVTERNMIHARSMAITDQISALQQSIGGLVAYAETLPDPDGKFKALLGQLKTLATNTTTTKLTEACREVLRARSDWMSALEVREALAERGFSFSGYTSNPLSSIHTTLKRLVGDQVAENRRGDETVFFWKRKPLPKPSTSVGGRR